VAKKSTKAVGSLKPGVSLSHDFYAIPISDFFKLAISVDCVIFGHQGKELKVLLIQRGAAPYHSFWALPGDLVYPNEDLDKAALRVLNDLTSIEQVFFEQVAVFGKPDRHPLGRVITTGYLALVEIKDYSPVASGWATQAVWHDVNDLPKLAFDHEEIFKTALAKLQDTVRHKPVGLGVLPEKFTITDLQELYEAIYDATYDKGNFRKKLNEWKHLVDLNEYQKNVAHRPAKMFCFDKVRYQELEKRGFSFDL
jgi:8-oxo-dGTP diphosphatase